MTLHYMYVSAHDILNDNDTPFQYTVPHSYDNTVIREALQQQVKNVGQIAYVKFRQSNWYSLLLYGYLFLWYVVYDMYVLDICRYGVVYVS